MPMSLGQIERKSCSSKKQYFTVAKAREVISSFAAKDGERMKIYQCRFCSKFHITSRGSYDSHD